MVKPNQSQSPAEHQVCNYPDCNCPLDAPADPNWCARRLPKARTISMGQVPPLQSPPSPPAMADQVYGCDEHYYDGCPNCEAKLGESPPRPGLLASRAFWIGGALSTLIWVLIFLAAKELLR